MQAVAPEMIRISRHIDPFVVRVLPPEVFRHAEYILQLDNGPHSGALKMLLYNVLYDPGVAEIRRRAVVPEDHIVETLGAYAVFLPPAPYRAHIVCGR